MESELCREAVGSYLVRKKKGKKSDATKSYHEDEGRLRGWSGRSKSTQFSAGEIKERAELFKNEYNREDLHDRVLVLQVMPDDYEMRELTARMELSEPGTTSKLASKGWENESKIPASEFCTDIVEMDDKEPPLDFAETSHQSYSISRGETSSNFDSPGFCEDDGCEAIAEDFPSHGNTVSEHFNDAAYSDKPTFEPVSHCNDSKTERTCIARSRDESSDSIDIKVSGESNYLKEDLIEESDTRAIDHSVTYSVSGMPIARKSDYLPEVKHSFPEIERCIGFGNQGSSESGSTKFGPTVNYNDKPESAVVEYQTSIGSAEEVESITSQSDESTSTGTGDVHLLREHRIYVHACWLAVNSHYFRSLLFESGMRECTAVEFSMKVTESEENAFMLLLQSFYDPDVLDNLDITPLMYVLRLSVKYDARFSSLKAKRVLEAKPLTLDVCETIIEAANSGGLPDLGGVMRNVEHFLLCEFEPLDETWESEKFASLSEHALRFILGSDRLVVQSENTVFIALMQWIQKNAELYGDITEYSDLLSLVRFEIMKPTYIHDVVREHEVATQLDNFDSVYLKAMTYFALPSKRRGGPAKDRQWCDPRTPTFMWILYPEPELFSFDEENSSTESSSFWYFGYKMHLRLDLSTSQDETGLYLVVENLVADGSVELTYVVEVKFGDGLHNSFTCDSFVYGRNDRLPAPKNYPFDTKYSVDEIRELVLGGSATVAITFEITVEKILND